MLEVSAGIGGARLELDGQLTGIEPRDLAIRLRPGVATLVGFDDQEPLFTSLRRRGIVADSPRIVVDATRRVDTALARPHVALARPHVRPVLGQKPAAWWAH